MASCACGPRAPGALLGLALLLALGCVLPAAAGAAEGDDPGVVLETDDQPACGEPAPERARCLVELNPAPGGSEALVGATPAGVAESPGSFAEPTCFGGENPFCGSGASHGFSPQDLQAAYKLPSWSAGAGETVAVVIAYDDPNAEADLAVYRQTYDLPPCTTANGCFEKVDQEGGASYPAPNAHWAAETSLDLDMVSAGCPKCDILLVEADDNTLGNLSVAVDTAAELGATQISNSYSAREIEVGKSLVEQYGEHYDHPGVAITAASGDKGYINEQTGSTNGKGECTNCSPSIPAGFDSVISVGGTALYEEAGASRGYIETGWFFSGSGCTLYVPKPEWQVDEGCPNRTANDASAVAAEFTPVSMYDTYGLVQPGWQTSGGTSVGAPLLAAAIALESGTLQSEGIEGIYENPGNWFDVTFGANYAYQGECEDKYLCTAASGYDGLTGVGSPNGGATATPPSAMTEPPTAVTGTTATLNAVVNPERSETRYRFQYGASSLYGHTIPAEGVKVGSHTQPTLVAQSVTGLQPGNVYHYRVVASSPGGTTHGPDRAFSTGSKVHLANVGSKGAGPGQLESPWGTAVDADGDVWVSDSANDRIVEYSPSGEFIQQCGSTGSGNGQLDEPTGIAVNLAGAGTKYFDHVYVSDSGNDRIQVFSPECEFLEAFGESGSGEGQLSRPMGLAFAHGGAWYALAPRPLLVVDSGNDRIEAFNWDHLGALWKEGQFLATFGSEGSGNGQFSSPSGIALVNSGEVGTEDFYVVDSGNDRVQVIEEKEFVQIHQSVSYEYAGQFGASGSGDGQLESPGGIAVDPTTGDLLVADSGNHRVEHFTLPAGGYAAKFGSKGAGAEDFESPQGVAVSPAGTAYVADAGNHRIGAWQPAQGAAPVWQVTATSAPEGASNSYLFGVSCVTGEVGCTAVGGYRAGGSSYTPLAERWNGTEWLLETTPKPGGAASAYLYSVSCPSTAACTGTGLYKDGAGVTHPLVESWNGSEWSLQTSAEPAGAQNALLSSVSCVAADECTAVGWWEDGSGTEGPWAERWDGSEWSVVSMPTPSGAEATYPTGVSCASSSACTSVGEYVNESESLVPFAEGWDGSKWSTQSMPNPSGATSTSVTGVSCSAATACTAVGYYEKASALLALAERWNGSEWSLQTMAVPSETSLNLPAGVSCTSATSCVAAGVSLKGGKFVTLAEQWNGTEWSVLSTPNGAGGQGWLTGGVSCGAPASCAAVGNTGSTFAEIFG